jgi:hypothetical protein
VFKLKTPTSGNVGDVCCGGVGNGDGSCGVGGSGGGGGSSGML